MINLIKNNSNGTRKNLFLNLMALGSPRTTRNGIEVVIIQEGENLANIYENGNVQFSGFKNLNEIINTVNK